MEELRELFKNIIGREELIAGVMSNLRDKSLDYERVNLKPVEIQGSIKIQFEYEYRNKVIHRNLDYQEALEEFYRLCQEEFRQVNLFTLGADYQILISKKGKVKTIKSPASRKPEKPSHNKQKNYILEDNQKHDFLIRLGVMNKDGRVIASRYDKFRQINRFLELVEDVIPEIEKEGRINIVDFGCGKSYLTFALYYYLVDILGLDVNIIGLDLKKDVIKLCNTIAEDLDYKDLTFIEGDIRDFTGLDSVDMVVTLHACDIATDAALVKAIDWDSKVILSVPCCQSEFYSKLDRQELDPMLKHGIIRERMASLVTDSLRAMVLEVLGYRVQLVEFIDMEHTHKNILIRAFKSQDMKTSRADYRKFKQEWGLEDIFIEEELKKIGIEL